MRNLPAETLVTAVDSLYEWQQPDRPEDLCLLRADGTEWLVTIAHEGDSYVVIERSELSLLRDTLPDLVATLIADDPG